VSNHRSLLRTALVVLLAVTLTATACGDGGGNDEAESAPPVGSPSKFTIWAPTNVQKAVESAVARFKNKNPGIEVEMVFAPGQDLEDRLIVGEHPDLYLTTARNLEELSADTEFVARTKFGVDRLELVVAPGNPKSITNLSVFDSNPLTTSGLCPREEACGRSARVLLDDQQIVPKPDVTLPNVQLVQGVAGGTIDATLVFRSQAVKARRNGAVEYVPLPSTQRIDLEYQIGTIVPGEAADKFLADFAEEHPSVLKILSVSGFAPLEGDEQ
jgi:ABC-type molybdate transport system substrate-binding protein